MLIPRVEHIDGDTEALAGRAISGRARGGMVTKLKAAKLATGSGIDVVIANGHAPDVLPRLAAGESLGTLFPATADRMESRKRWIRAAVAPRGHLVVDAGAARALVEEGKSLLPAGVVACEGSFRPADLVEIVTVEGRRLAVGVTRYSDIDVQRIRGRRSDRILPLLGYSYGDEVVHRDDLVLD
jgi:glutamate 5-kinase